MRKYGYLVVEGPHDIEFAYRLLSPFKLQRVQYEKDLDGFFAPLIPRKYPPDGDLQKRMPIPLFLQNDTHTIAIHSAIGDSRLVDTIEENAALIDITSLTGIGIFLDADKKGSPATRYATIQSDLAGKGFILENQAGAVTLGPPKLGAYVLPDNASTGTLEDLLLDSASNVYPDLLLSAKAYIYTAMKGTDLINADKADFKKPAGRNKAIIGAMSSILRPGKAVQVSMQDNRWLRDQALSLPRIQAVQTFLKDLFNIP
ncbi:MAG: DUF3226 domain-containing protein [Methylococcus sp.]